MGKVYLICGKICSGKSYYAKSLKEKYNAVILSTDEATYDLINNEQGEFYNIFAQRVNNYLKKKLQKSVKQVPMLYWIGDFGQKKTESIFQHILNHVI